MAGKFEVYKDKSGGYRFRLKAGNGEVIASSESYKSKASALRPITDEGVAVGGAFDSDTATGMMPVAHRVAGVLAFR